MYIQVLLRSIFSLIVLFLLTKWIGCRQMSEMSMFDYINGITIGSIAAELAASDIDFMIPLIAMVTYGLAAVLLSFCSDKSMVMRRIIVGKPHILYINDMFMYQNMKKNKIDIFEVLMGAREAGYFDLSQVQAVILESNGRMSFLPKAEHRPITPRDMALEIEKDFVCGNIILEGKIMSKNLKHIGRDEKWLRKQMEMHNIRDEKEVFLGIYDGNETCHFIKKSVNKHDIDLLI